MGAGFRHHSLLTSRRVHNLYITAGVAFLYDFGGWKLSIELCRQCMVLEHHWLHAMTPRLPPKEHRGTNEVRPPPGRPTAWARTTLQTTLHRPPSRQPCTGIRAVNEPTLSWRTSQVVGGVDWRHGKRNSQRWHLLGQGWPDKVAHREDSLRTGPGGVIIATSVVVDCGSLHTPAFSPLRVSLLSLAIAPLTRSRLFATLAMFALLASRPRLAAVVRRRV